MTWFREYTVKELNDQPKEHIDVLIGIEFTEITDYPLSAIMSVGACTYQPYGILLHSVGGVIRKCCFQYDFR
jgi:hypothetical protein